MAPEEEGAEDGFGEDVEDAVEDGFGVGRDDVAALGNPPCDRVQKPEEDGPGAAEEVGAADVRAQHGGLFARGPGDSPCDPEEGDAAEDKISPLI